MITVNAITADISVEDRTFGIMFGLVRNWNTSKARSLLSFYYMEGFISIDIFWHRIKGQDIFD